MWETRSLPRVDPAGPSLPERISLRSDQPPDFIRRMIDQETECFEQHVLATLFGNAAFAEQIGHLLCIDPCTEKTRYPVVKPWQDFMRPIPNALYRCVRKYREAKLDVGAQPNRELVATILKQIAMEPHGVIGPDDVHDALTVFDQIMALDTYQATEMVRVGCIYWLRKRRAFLVIQNETAMNPSWDPGKISQTLAVHNKLIDDLLVGTEGPFVAFDQIAEPPRVELIPSGLRACDDSLGGGFGKGEFTLVIAPSGGGKTTFGCQLAATFGLQGNKVLFITTEQPPSDLQPRIVSNVCGIPCSRLRGGLQQSALSLDERGRYEKICVSLGANLHFADWSKSRSRSIQTDLRAEVERFVAKHGRVDVVIFDWIGGALGPGLGKDQHALRLAFQDTGDALAAIARELGVVVIGFGQAAIGSTRGKKRIDQDDIAECKSLGRSATNVIGISALRDETDDDGPSYSQIQYLFVSKARKSAGGCRRFRRQFELQRLADV